MMLPSYSQTSSSNCTVPCYTLRNAIKTKYDLDLSREKVIILRDSISLLNQGIFQRDTMLLNKKTEITNLKTNELKLKEESDENKKRGDSYKSEVNKQKTYKWIAIVVGSITTLCSLIFL
jgi:hypothetical protein